VKDWGELLHAYMADVIFGDVKIEERRAVLQSFTE